MKKLLSAFIGTIILLSVSTNLIDAAPRACLTGENARLLSVTRWRGHLTGWQWQCTDSDGNRRTYFTNEYRRG